MDAPKASAGMPKAAGRGQTSGAPKAATGPQPNRKGIRQAQAQARAQARAEIVASSQEGLADEFDREQESASSLVVEPELGQDAGAPSSDAGL
jgi:hypothetical protein